MLFDWDFLVFLAAFSVAVFTPGPGLAAMVATVLAGGARRAIWFCVGMIGGDLTWLALSLSGLALIASQIPIVFTAIKWAGVAYLVYLALKIWRSSPLVDNRVTQPRQKNAVARILAGYSVTMGNPKAMLFYLALLPNLMDPQRISIAMVLSLCMAVIIILALAFTTYALAAEKARRAMNSNQSLQKLNRITATALGGTALWIATR